MKAQNLQNITAHKMDTHIDVLTAGHSTNILNSLKKAWIEFNKNLEEYGAAAAAAIRH